MKKKARVRRITRKPANAALGAGLIGVAALKTGYATKALSDNYIDSKMNEKHNKTVKKMDAIQKKARIKLENKIHKRIKKGGKKMTKSESTALKNLGKPFKFK